MLTDAQLLQLVRDGDEDSFGELYRRHIDVARAAARSLMSWAPEAEDVVADAFTRVLSIVQRGGGPEESFRPYLLTCVRHACYDRSQGVARSTLVDPSDMADLAHARQRGELDPHDRSENNDLLAHAFASLPERWQLVLWSTEVDGRRPAELARELGLAPGAVASLAYRAREGLTEAFLSAHLQRPAAPACAAIRPRLAAFVRDNVNGREEAQIQDHLDQCEECQGLVSELHELNRPLRGILLPAVAGVSASAYLAVGPTGGRGGLLSKLLEFLQQRPVFGGAAAASVAIFAGATLTGMAPLQPPDAPPVPVVTSAVMGNGSVAIAGTGGLVDLGGVPPTGGVVPPTMPGVPGVPPGAPGAGGTATPVVNGGPSSATDPAIGGADGGTPTVPGLGVPGISLPPISLPPLSLPSLSLPSVSLPAVSLPPVSLPAVSVPPVELPGLGTVTVPVVTVPVVTVPVITVPVVTVPPITVAPITVPPITVPEVTVAPITLPSLTPTTASP